MRLRVVFAIFATACTQNLEVPSNAHISCEEDKQCPDGWTCSQGLSRCVRRGQDATPPAIVDGTFAVSNPLVGLGQSTTITFDVTEALGEPPEVKLVWVGDVPAQPAAFAGMQSDSLTYTFEYAAQETEPAVPASVVISLLDPAGNPAEAFFERQIEFDFDTPELVAGTTTVDLIPLPNLLGDVTAATIGTVVRVSFTTTEPLGDQTAVRTSEPEQLAFAPTAIVGASNVYEYLFEVGHAYQETSHTIVVDAVDRAGNSATLTLGSVDVDTNAPVNPDLTGDRIIYRRVPWGIDTSDVFLGAPTTLRGEQFSAEANATLVASENTDQALLREIGRTPIGLSGEFAPFEIGGADLPHVYVTAVDDAGNASDTVEVQSVEWVVSLIGKQAGLQVPNPHRLAVDVFTPAGHLSPTASEPSNLQLTALQTIDQSGAPIRAERAWTRRLAPEAEKPVLWGAAVSFNPFQQVLSTFGNIGATFGNLPDAWVYTQRGWFEVTTLGPEPERRSQAAMAYDSHRDRAILFGGRSGLFPDNLLNDTWEWADGQWFEMSPDEALGSPPARVGHHLSYDSARGRFVMFGGCADVTCDTLLDDTWEWDGAQWHDVSVAGGPSARAFAAMAYDATNEQTVLFGGCALVDVYILGVPYCGTRAGDTWVWNGTTWDQRCEDGAGGADHCDPMPSPRSSAAMTFDPDTEDVVLYGGDDGTDKGCRMKASTEFSGDLWRWNGTTWSVEVSNDPPCIIQGTLVGDSHLADLVLVTGYDSSPPNAILGSMWAWDEGDWRMVWGTTSAQPEGRTNAALAFDEGAGAALLFGGEVVDGCDGGEDPLCHKTWLWRGGTWSEAASSGPDSRRDHGMVYDRTDDRVLMYGGVRPDETECDGLSSTASDPVAYCDSLWEWDTANGSWTLLCGGDSGTACDPGPRTARAMVWDSRDERVLLFGGYSRAESFGGSCPSHATARTEAGSPACYFADLWAWKDGTWTEFCGGPTTSACGIRPRYGAAAAYHDGQQRLYVFGGRLAEACRAGYASLLCNDLWSWDGTEWTLLCGADTTCPTLGEYNGSALVYDRGRARLYRYGGGGALSYPGTWEWSGTEWGRLVPPFTEPPLGQFHVMAYASDREQIVYVATGGEVWELDARTELRPAAVFDIDWSAARAPFAELDRIELRIAAGGRGYSTDVVTLGDLQGDPQPGVELSAWNTRLNRWDYVCEGNFDAITPGLLTCSIHADTSDYLVSNRHIYLRLVPLHGSGNGTSEGWLMTDYVEATVVY